MKASGIGVGDALLERTVLELRRNGQMVAFGDVAAPATLDRIGKDPGDGFRPLIPRYDLIPTDIHASPIASICARHGGDRTRMMDVLYDVHHALGHVSSQALDVIAFNQRLGL